MLVLTRQKDQVIVIGDDIEICVVKIRGNNVKLGIVAPKDIPVHRKEVYDAIHCSQALVTREKRVRKVIPLLGVASLTSGIVREKRWLGSR